MWNCGGPAKIGKFNFLHGERFLRDGSLLLVDTTFFNSTRIGWL
jgi:hypothetical protein